MRLRLIVGRASLELMWPVSRGDLVGLHKAQVAPALNHSPPVVSSLRCILFVSFRTTTTGFLDLVSSDHHAHPVKMISFRDN